VVGCVCVPCALSHGAARDLSCFSGDGWRNMGAGGCAVAVVWAVAVVGATWSDTSS
jgi:hypothetical protein